MPAWLDPLIRNALKATDTEPTLNTRDDVIAALQIAFPSSDAATIPGVLDLYGTESYERERERVQLAIVALRE